VFKVTFDLSSPPRLIAICGASNNVKLYLFVKNKLLLLMMMMIAPSAKLNNQPSDGVDAK